MREQDQDRARAGIRGSRSQDPGAGPGDAGPPRSREVPEPRAHEVHEPRGGDHDRAEGASSLGAAVADVFEPSGRLETAHPSYERRGGQEEMARAVGETLRDGGTLLIEAGTGVGKTLAYLVPAALWGGRVIVSTGTKTLQDQIIEKDLPFVTDRLGIDVPAAVVKGRDNYLCLRRYEEFDRAPLLPTIQESEIFEKMRAWAGSTETGDRGEAKELPDDVSFWRRINARGDTCTGTRCEHYEACYLTKVRRKAEAARLIVVNHHLFFADLALREDAFGKVLPDYDAVVFDEAHLLEETATLFFGVTISSTRVFELADDGGRLLAASRRKRGARGLRDEGGRRAPGDLSMGPMPDGGFDPAFPSGAGGRARAAEEDFEDLDEGLGTTLRRRRRARARRGPLAPEADALRAAALDFFAAFGAEPGRRLLRDAVRGERFEPLLEALDMALGELRDAADALTPPSDEAAAVERRCREIAAALQLIARGALGSGADAEDGQGTTRADPGPPSSERYVYWVEARGRSVTLAASPVDVSDLLDETLFSRLHASVLTSATLSVGGSFEFVRARLGTRDASDRIVPSPFDYPRQTVLYLPAAMPEPRSAGYSDRMVREIEALLEISRGRAFLLFTSHAELRRVEGSLRGRTRHPVLVQGERPRARLLEEFRETPGAILLGAASFWHGVDVAGEALSLVVVDKIPFDVPNDPLVAARIDRIRRLGGDPFNEYQVPSAAIELKQGLGRLIRSRSDRGILAVLDARMRTRGYGRSLLASLPPFPVVTDIEEVRRFFAAPPRGA